MIKIKPKSPDSRWCALDIKNGEIILAEGKTPSEVEEIMKEKGIEKYVFSWISEPGKTYIF